MSARGELPAPPGRPIARGRPVRMPAWLLAWVRAAAAVGIITGLYFLLPLESPDLTGGPGAGRVAGVVVGMAALVWLVARQVRRALAGGRVLAERLAVLLTTVNVVAVFFAVLYVLLADQFIGLETRLDALYFSVATLTTVGFGDVAATGQAARAVVTVQMFFDLVIVTSAVSIVVNSLPGRPHA